MGPRRARPLWTCPSCGRTFANANQSHACSRHALAEHLDRVPPGVQDLFRRFVALIEDNGPVTIVPEKTRIAFHIRMSFAAVQLRQRWMDGHVVLARRLDHPRFLRIDTISPRNHVHAFRITTPAELEGEAGAEVAAWLAEAYRVGEQRHLD